MLLRKDLLRERLLAIGMDADGLESAVEESMTEDAASSTYGGYDGRFGKSAIRACKSFYYSPKIIPGTSDNDNDGDPDQSITRKIQLQAAAARTARQIQFLWKRHQSHQAEYVRHHDAAATASTNQTKKEKARFPLILVLDNLRSAQNVGSIFRTADAVGIAQVCTVGITPHPHGNGAEKIRKCALGAEYHVPTRHFDTLVQALESIRKSHPQSSSSFQIIGMETTEKSVLYSEFSFSKSGVALILGNEVTGVDTNVLNDLDAIVEIPMFGTKNSLNVAACAPVVLYEILRQWNYIPSQQNHRQK
jgi:tRNA G18 (ribose-2'-O)-methylase SpoU